MAKNEKKKVSTEVGNFDAVIGILESEFGAGIIKTDKNRYVNVDYFPSGIATLDLAIGCGGIPQGRVIELFGKESSGKTTTCLEIIASCQKHYFEDKGRYGKVVFIDAEHALDIQWAETLGVDVSKLAISQPDYGEQALRIAETLIESKQVDLIVIDSVAALIPKAELDGEIGDNMIGTQARMMSQACRKLVAKSSKSNTTVIFINQVREKIGVMFGNPETTPGGKALKFYSSIRMEISKGSAVKDGEIVVGFSPKIKLVKNKVGAPFTSAEFTIYTNGKKPRGIDKAASLIEVALKRGIVTAKGTHYSYGDVKLGNGAGNASSTLWADKELYVKLSKEVHDKIFKTERDQFNVSDQISGLDEDSPDDGFDSKVIVDDLNE